MILVWEANEQDYNMRLIKMILLIMVFSPSACSPIRTARIVYTKAMGFPERKSYSYSNFDYRPDFELGFSSNDEIMLSFYQRSKRPASIDKNATDTSEMSFVVLLISKESGKLITKKEWPIPGKPNFLDLKKYYHRIFPLPDGGYVLLFNRNLQVLDSSLNIIHEKILDSFPKGYLYNSIYVPLHGPYFVLCQGLECVIIDYAAFKEVEKIDISKMQIRGIYEDKFLIHSSDENDNNINYLFEKKIGNVDSYSEFKLKINRSESETYLYDGSAMVFSNSNHTPYWFTIKNGETSNPVFVYEKDAVLSGLFMPALFARGPSPARSAPVVAISASKDRGWDLGLTSWVIVYDINTQQILKQTRNYNDFDYALSSDGRILAIFNEKKGTIKLYDIPAPDNVPATDSKKE